MNNCVGYHNHAYFFRFLFYVILACLLGAGIIIARVSSVQVKMQGRRTVNAKKEKKECSGPSNLLV